MATSIFSALLVSLFVRAVLSLPVAQDFKSVNKTYATFYGSVIKRYKRQVIVGNYICAKGEVWLWKNQMCVSNETYNELKADDYEEITMGSQDENMTPHPTKATTELDPGPVSRPDETPHPQTESTPEPTKLPRNTPRPKSTSPDPPTTSLPVPLQVNGAGQTFSPHTMTTTLVFVLYVFLFHRPV